ncbi:hypothetical protein C4D60_Mb08t12390 [Musa balbisiana]|uniref:Uncharacterized protein n=1 Tax=Musa balbisiana TaxID=52838 RepID=A0A4S8K382_MUSBA|nr:hypothetical protein C4D60_Mb08t12390 [Musa balbisiana]
MECRPSLPILDTAQALDFMSFILVANPSYAIAYRGTAATIEGRLAIFTDPAPTVSRFSTTGPDVFDGQMTPADVLKPDIVAPGEQI